MNHPLTDEMIANLACTQAFTQPLTDEKYDDIAESMRSAYDLAIERMSQWVEENGHEYVTYDYELGCQSNFSQMITDFKQAMRPQEEI